MEELIQDTIDFAIIARLKEIKHGSRRLSDPYLDRLYRTVSEEEIPDLYHKYRPEFIRFYKKYTYTFKPHLKQISELYYGTIYDIIAVYMYGGPVNNVNSGIYRTWFNYINNIKRIPRPTIF